MSDTLRASFSSLKLRDNAVSASRKTTRAVREIKALLGFATVLLVGGALFSALERSTEVQQRVELASFLQRMQAKLTDAEFHELVGHMSFKNDRVAEELAAAAGSPSSGAGADPVLAPHDWDFVGACFFCFTAATTIGYGNYTPSTAGGKLLLVLYAIIAIPACLKAFAEISDRALDTIAKRFRRRQVFDKRIEQAFHYFDLDSSGKLEANEARSAMRILGYPMDESPELVAK